MALYPHKHNEMIRPATNRLVQRLSLLLILLFCHLPASAGEIRVAVASNFTEAIKEIADLFEQRTGHRIKLAFGSTGKHYAQIRNGAPFEVFFAADVKRAKLLDEEGIARPGSRFTYAIGKVVLWSPEPDLIDPHGRILNKGDFRHMALANPKLAPYGRAAVQILQAQGVLSQLQDRMVRGENIGQAYQFVSSGNAELGFVAYSQIKRPDNTPDGSYWEPPQSLYKPIEQQAVLLRDSDVARQFLEFVKGAEAREIIQAHGYGVS